MQSEPQSVLHRNCNRAVYSMRPYFESEPAQAELTGKFHGFTRDLLYLDNVLLHSVMFMCTYQHQATVLMTQSGDSSLSKSSN